MEQSTLRAFEAQCIQEDFPACQTTCLLHVEARTFCAQMAEGRVADARKTLDRAMPLAGLLGYLCNGPCRNHCRRGEVDDAIDMPLLERACVSATQPGRIMALPSSGKKIAVAGAGLSSLCIAWELGKKGHSVTIHHTGPPGGRLKYVYPPELPETALQEALTTLTSLRVSFAAVEAFSPKWLEQALSESQAVYLGLDDANVELQSFGFDLEESACPVQRITGATAHPKVFAGGLPENREPSFIEEAASGRRAAGSIVRILQGVNPETAREHEMPYPTTLFTDVSVVDKQPVHAPADPLQPTEAEAVQEARRCIQCECLECVKRCAYLKAYNGYPKRYAREIYNNLSVIHGLRRANAQINSCAQCGLCAAVCPHDADMGKFCATARREMVKSNRMPPSAHEFALEDMVYSNSPDIAFFRHQPGHEHSAFAFFPGCQLPASMPIATDTLYAHLTRHLTPELASRLGVTSHDPTHSWSEYSAHASPEFGIGFWFHCCAAPAKWSGREILTATSVATMRQQWKDAGEPALIMACASCMAFFKSELPEIPVTSLWHVLAACPLPEDAKAARQTIAVHDPCTLRHDQDTRGQLRNLLANLRQTSTELPLGQALTRCCGYGGLADAANPAMGRAYAQSRAEDTELPLLAYCIMCRDRLAAVGKPTLHVLDLLFPQMGPEAAAMRPAPGISARQENRLAFRQRLLETLWNEPPARNPRMEAISLIIDTGTAAKLEARRILHTDIKQVLIHAQDNGAMFHNPTTGHHLASLRLKQVTFWVEYSRNNGGGYVVHDAYCHRMVVPGVPGEGADSCCSREGYSQKGGRM